MNIDKKNTKDKEHKINISPKIEKKEDHVVVDGKKYQFEADEELECKTCCGQMTSCDKPLMEFLSKFIISSSVLAFSMYQLANNQGDTSYFASTISLILGIYINNRENLKKDKKDN
jgi:hypothetical protein